MIGFWPSDAVLVTTQAALVCGPRPPLPAALRLRGRWAWLVLPVSLGATVALLAWAPGLGVGYAVLALVAVPVLAAVSLHRLGRAQSAMAARLLAVLAAAALFVVAWAFVDSLVGQAAAVVLTALSCCPLASWLAGLTAARLLKVGIVVMAALDAVLVFGNLLEGPNDTLNAATPGLELPHLQVAVFGSALIGYGDLFIAAVLGTVVAGISRPVVALLVLLCSAGFDLLFLVVPTLPATVPVAVALVVVEGSRRILDRRVRLGGGSPPGTGRQEEGASS